MLFSRIFLFMWHFWALETQAALATTVTTAVRLAPLDRAEGRVIDYKTMIFTGSHDKALGENYR